MSGRRRLTASQWFAIAVALLVFVGVLGTVASRDRAQPASAARASSSPTGSSPAAITRRAAPCGADRPGDRRPRLHARPATSASSSPTESGQRDERAALARLRAIAALDEAQLPARADRGGRPARARRWQHGLRASRRSRPCARDPEAARTPAAVEAGKERFDAFRAAVDRPAGACSTRRASDGARRAGPQRRHRALLGARHRHRDPAHRARRGAACCAARSCGRCSALAGARARGRARRLRARGRAARAPARSSSSAEDVDAMRARIVAELEALRVAEADLRALQRRARAVRLRRLARPPGAAAQGRELLPAAPAALRRAARRARRPVHRLRGRRRPAHAGPDQRPAGVLAGGAGRAAAHRRRLRRARGRGCAAISRGRSRRAAPTIDVAGRCPPCTATRGCCGSSSRT